MSGKQLAKLAGISTAYLSQLEKGRRDAPSKDVLNGLAAALKLASSELLTGSPPPDAALPEQELALHGDATNADLADLASQIAEMRAELRVLQGQMDTLLGLLGQPVRKAIGLENNP